MLLFHYFCSNKCSLTKHKTSCKKYYRVWA